MSYHEDNLKLLVHAISIPGTPEFYNPAVLQESCKWHVPPRSVRQGGAAIREPVHACANLGALHVLARAGALRVHMGPGALGSHRSCKSLEKTQDNQPGRLERAGPSVHSRAIRVHNTSQSSRESSTDWRCHSAGAGGASSTRISARLKRVQEHSSPVTMYMCDYLLVVVLVVPFSE